MRIPLLMTIGLLAIGCMQSHWKVVPAEGGPILIDGTSGATWSRDYYQRPDEPDRVTPYWKEMQRGQAATRPSRE